MTSTIDAPPQAADDHVGGAVTLRSATAVDAVGVHRLITDNLVAGHLLPRPLGEIELHVPRFLVAAAGGRIVGCGELARLSRAVGEVRSLVVDKAHRGAGLGRRLLAALVDEARRQGYPTVCAFTHRARPFVRAGFSIVPHTWVPEKIATDCHRCEWFRRCGQYAVVLNLAPAAPVPARKTS
ncbi:MAG: GNAT family N-acetyltransferase [Acidobacteria bacterium]|nr:GNAT family N-acetyltransferase [Acidobacteriota bacterium]